MKKIIIKTYQNKDREASKDIIRDELSVDVQSLSYNEKGKPYLKDGSFFFNISHSRGIIGIAISDSEVGFDLERIKDSTLKYTENVYDKVLNEDDKKHFSKNIVSIQKVFTIKEAYLKYLGIGLVMDIDNIIIDYENNTVKYHNYGVGYYQTFEYCDILFSVVSDSNYEYEIIYKDLS